MSPYTHTDERRKKETKKKIIRLKKTKEKQNVDEKMKS